MIKELYIISEDKPEVSILFKHIQYNILMRLRNLKYVSYVRINISLVEDKEVIIEREYNNRIDVSLNFSKEIIERPDSQDNIIQLYKGIHHLLATIWIKNEWNVKDLNLIFIEIEKSNYESNYTVWKPISSVNKKYKAEVFCELFPSYANYYILFFEKKSLIHKILFLKGKPDPGIIFTYFANGYWKGDEYFILSDFVKEIFYVFSVNHGNFSIEYRPIKMSLEQCQNIVKAFQYDAPQDALMKASRQ